jgi:bacteriorhodopsin
MELWNDVWKRISADASWTTYALAGSLCLLLYVLAWCRIYAKAGQHPALGFLMLIPGLNLIMLTAFGLGRWPIETELAEIREVRKAVHRADARRLRRVG